MADRSVYDQNRNKGLIVSSNDGLRNPVELWADPTTHALKVDASISVDAGFNLQQVGGANISLGQALSASSLPVVLPAAQITALTPPAAITNYSLETGGNLATLAGAISASVAQINVKQMNGVSTSMGNGTTDTGTQRVTISSDSTGQVKLASNSGVNIGNVGGISATGAAVPANAFYIAGVNSGNLTGVGVNTSFNDTSSNSQSSFPVGSYNLVFNGTQWERQRSMGSVTAGTTTGIATVGVVAGPMPTGTLLNTYSVHITSNTTTTPTAATAYISSIVISIDVIATTAGTLTIKDKSGTPLTLVNGLNTTTAVSTTPTILNFQRPIKMTGGIDIVTAASVGQATLDIWIDYYQ